MKKLLILVMLTAMASGCYYVRPNTEREYVLAHPEEVGEQVFNAVRNKQIYLGMEPYQVKASWGHPSDINRSIGSYGVHEQWVYRHGSYVSSSYVYFENDKVTSIQN